MPKVRGPKPLAALAWVPGRQVPPRLLAVACNGALLGATMDATMAASDVWKEATRKVQRKSVFWG